MKKNKCTVASGLWSSAVVDWILRCGRSLSGIDDWRSPYVTVRMTFRFEKNNKIMHRGIVQNKIYNMHLKNSDFSIHAEVLTGFIQNIS